MSNLKVLRKKPKGRKKLYGKLPSIRSLILSKLQMNCWHAKKYGLPDSGMTWLELQQYAHGQRILVNPKAKPPSRSGISLTLQELKNNQVVEHKVIGITHKYFYVDREDRKKK